MREIPWSPNAQSYLLWTPCAAVLLSGPRQRFRVPLWHPNNANTDPNKQGTRPNKYVFRRRFPFERNTQIGTQIPHIKKIRTPTQHRAIDRFLLNLITFKITQKQDGIEKKTLDSFQTQRSFFNESECYHSDQELKNPSDAIRTCLVIAC
jgi:hypothetical protein